MPAAKTSEHDLTFNWHTCRPTLWVKKQVTVFFEFLS